MDYYDSLVFVLKIKITWRALFGKSKVKVDLLMEYEKCLDIIIEYLHLCTYLSMVYISIYVSISTSIHV